LWARFGQGEKLDERLVAFGDDDLFAFQRPLDQPGEVGLGLVNVHLRHNPTLAKLHD